MIWDPEAYSSSSLLHVFNNTWEPQTNCGLVWTALFQMLNQPHCNGIFKCQCGTAAFASDQEAVMLPSWNGECICSSNNLAR